MKTKMDERRLPRLKGRDNFEELSMPEKMKIKITKAQYYALNDIRDLQQDAHYMVI